MTMRSVLALAVMGAALACGYPLAANAGERSAKADRDYPAQSSEYRSGPRVKGYVARRGGYSYIKEDAINTYGDGRGRYGVAGNLRDPSLEKQTSSGPFDHGFFYKTGVGSDLHGGDAPFLH